MDSSFLAKTPWQISHFIYSDMASYDFCAVFEDENAAKRDQIFQKMKIQWSHAVW